MSLRYLKLRNLPKIDLSKYKPGTTTYHGLKLYDDNGNVNLGNLVRPSRELRRYLKAQQQLELEEDRLNALPFDEEYPVPDKQAHEDLLARIIEQNAKITKDTAVWPVEPPMGKDTIRLKEEQKTVYDVAIEKYRKEYEELRRKWAGELGISVAPLGKTQQLERDFYGLDKKAEEIDKNKLYFHDENRTLVSRQELVDRAIAEYKAFYSLVDNRNKNLLFEPKEHEANRINALTATSKEIVTPDRVLAGRSNDLVLAGETIHDLKQQSADWLPTNNEDAIKEKIKAVFLSTVINSKMQSAFSN